MNSPTKCYPKKAPTACDRPNGPHPIPSHPRRSDPRLEGLLLSLQALGSVSDGRQAAPELQVVDVSRPKRRVRSQRSESRCFLAQKNKNMRSVGFQGNTQRTTLLPRFFWGDPLKRYVHAGSPSKSVRIPLGGCWDAAPNNWCGMLFTQSKYRFIVVSVLSPLRWRLALPPTFSIGRLNQRCARCRRKRTGITIWCAMSPSNGCLPEQSQAARQSPVALQS